MSRDMKRRHTESASPRRRGGSTLVGLFVGLVIGVVLAAAVAWYTSRGATPFVNRAVPADKTAPAVEATQPVPAEPSEPAPLSGKPDTGERRFQFYDILQGKEPMPSRDAGQSKPDANPSDLKPVAQPIYLQAGSFSKDSDADNQKALLAMQGIESVVQQVMVQDKTYYRVRLGPFARPEDANKVRQELLKSGIEVTAVK